MRAGLVSRQQARRHLGENDTDYLIGVIGRLHPKKNPLAAQAGFQLAAAELGPSAKMVFVGDGELAQSLRGADNVHLTGFVPNARRYLRAFDAIVSTTSAREAFGMSIIEALVAEVPVICTDQPGPREVIGGCGRLVADGDPSALAAAMIQMKREGPARPVQAGYRRVVDEFSIAAVARRLSPILS